MKLSKEERLILQEAARVKRKILQENQQPTLLEELIEDIEVQLDDLQDEFARLGRHSASTAYEKGVNWVKLAP